MKPPILLTLMGIFMISLGSCTLISDADKIKPVDFQPTYAIPIANTSIRLDELLDNFDTDGILEVDPDGLLIFNYDTTVSIYDGNDYDGVIDFESQVDDTLSTLTLGPLLSQSITRAIIKEGVLTYFVEANTPGDYTLTIEILDAKRNGNTLKLERTEFFNSSVSGEISLVGYEFITPQEELKLRTILRASGSNQLVNPKEARIGFKDLAFSELEGRSIAYTFGNKIDSLNPMLFPSEVDGKAYFSDPSLSLTFRNSFGIPLQITVNEIFAKGINNQGQKLESTLLDDPFLIDYPRFNEKGEERSTTLTLDQTNSNFVEFVNVIPQSFRYNFGSSAIYQAASPADPDFFLIDTSKLELDMNFRLPLNLRLEEFTFSDTLDLDVDFSELSGRGEAEFKLISENAIPFTLRMQVYFLDFSGAKIDSLFAGFDEVLGAASVNDEGEVLEPAVREFFFTLNAERFNSLSNASQLEIRSAFSTSHKPDKTVKLFEDATLGLKLGVKTKIGQ